MLIVYGYLTVQYLMTSFALLWAKMLDSSVWQLSKETRLVWITLLCMKDADGVVRGAITGIAHRARVSEEECRKAFEELSSPDPDSQTETDDGRRIKRVPEGWEILNHDKYRFSSEAKREVWREQQAKWRAKQKAKRLEAEGKKHKRGKPLAGEEQYLAMERAGKDVSCEPGNQIPLPKAAQ